MRVVLIFTAQKLPKTDQAASGSEAAKGRRLVEGADSAQRGPSSCCKWCGSLVWSNLARLLSCKHKFKIASTLVCISTFQAAHLHFLTKICFSVVCRCIIGFVAAEEERARHCHSHLPITSTFSLIIAAWEKLGSTIEGRLISLVLTFLLLTIVATFILRWFDFALRKFSFFGPLSI